MNRLLRPLLALALTAAAALGVTADVANASHFRYGHLTWQPLGGNSARFTLVNAFRRSGYPGTAGDGRAAIGDLITETIGGTDLAFGDGAVTPTLQYRVIAIDPPNNWLLAQAVDPADPARTKTTIDHTYPAPMHPAGGPWIASINSCCRTSAEVNNPGGNYRVLTEVELASGGRSPVSGLPAIVNLTCSNPIASFVVPASDPDPNTQLVFRLATSSEAGAAGGFDQPGPPNAPNALSIDPVSGVVSWNTNGATCGGLYSCQVVIEDRDAATGAKRGQVAVDFLIELVECPPGNQAPVFDAPTPCGAVLQATAGSAMSFPISASDADGGAITLNSAGLPAGASTTPSLPVAGNPAAATFNWTPTIADVGNHLVTFSATDECGQQALCSVTISVTNVIEAELDIHPTSCPNPMNVRSNGMTPVAVLGTDAFDPFQIDISTVRLEGVAPVRTALGDVSAPVVDPQEKCECTTDGPDGYDDLLLKFSTQDLVAVLGGVNDRDFVQLTLTGNLLDGTPFQARDCVWIIMNGPEVAPAGGEVRMTVSHPTVRDPEARITYAVPDPARVRISVIDVSGRIVGRLVDDWVPTGEHSLRWNPSLPSGVYFVRMSAGSKTLVERLVLSR